MSDIYKYVNWNEYFMEEVFCQLGDLEYYDPKLVDCCKESILSFMKYEGVELVEQDCCFSGDNKIIVYGIGHDEDGVSLTFCIGDDDLINHVEYR